MDPEDNSGHDSRPLYYPNGEKIEKIPVRRKRPSSANAINTLGAYTEVKAGEFYVDENEIIEKAVSGGIKARKF